MAGEGGGERKSTKLCKTSYFHAVSDSYNRFLPAFATELANYLIWTHSLTGVFRKDLMFSSGGIWFPFTPSKQFNWPTRCVLHKTMACRVFSPREEHFLMWQYIMTLTTHEFPALLPWVIFMSRRNGFSFSSHEELTVFSLWWEKRWELNQIQMVQWSQA